MAEHRRYAEEFKLQAARLIVEHGYSYRQASQQLGVHGWSIRQWVKKFRESGQLPPKDQPVAAAEELKAARKELLRLRMENEILKKAAAYFAKESL
jgi:transposase